MAKKNDRFVVTKETESGRNVEFENRRTGETISRPTFVREIEQGKHPNYHVRKINGVPTPVSNPDGRKGNNLD